MIIPLTPSENAPKIVAVIGATGSGKSALGAKICHDFKGEIVSADSRQVYRGLDIGTNKEKLGVEQHLIDIQNPGQKMTVAEYQSLAYRCIDRLIENKILPVLTGGSGLYAESVINGYVFKEGERPLPRYRVLKLGIEVDREELKEKIKSRTDKWLEMGILDEIKDLLKQGVSPSWLKSLGMEYRYFTEFIQGDIELSEAINKTNIAQNQFIKRQYTWWRRHSDVIWVKDYVDAKIEVEYFFK